ALPVPEPRWWIIATFGSSRAGRQVPAALRPPSPRQPFSSCFYRYCSQYAVKDLVDVLGATETSDVDLWTTVALLLRSGLRQRRIWTEGCPAVAARAPSKGGRCRSSSQGSDLWWGRQATASHSGKVTSDGDHPRIRIPARGRATFRHLGNNFAPDSRVGGKWQNPVIPPESHSFRSSLRLEREVARVIRRQPERAGP